MRIIVTFASLAALVLVTGCDEDEAPEEPTETARITYSRTGGFAAINETFTVHSDGSGRFERRFVEDALVDRFQLKPSRLEELNDVLHELDFDSLDTGQSASCPDCFSYEISYGGKTLTADDVTVKPELRQAISALDEAIRTRSSP